MKQLEAVIAERDGEAMQNMIEAFKDEVVHKGWEMIGVFMNFVCEDMPHLKISPKEPNHPLYVAMEEYMRKEVLAVSNEMMEQLAVTTANMIHDSGWDFVPPETGEG